MKRWLFDCILKVFLTLVVMSWVPGAIWAANPAWQDEWDKTVAAAKKEGKLVIYTGAGPGVKKALSIPFKAKFGIDIEFVTGRGLELAQKILAERRAGIYLGDIYWGPGTPPLNNWKPAGVLAPIKPLLILPEVLDSRVYVENKIPFTDKEKKYVICFGMAIANTLAINADLVKLDEIKGYADLLNPKWKDKIVLSDPTIQGTGQDFFWVTSMFYMTPDFHRKLIKQNPMITRNMRQQVEWLVRGKYPVAVAPFKEVVAEFQKSGAQIKWIVPAEGVYVSGGNTGNVAYIDRAPHPNAAKVFANWLLTKETLTIWSRNTLLQTAREDVPTDFLPPESRREPKKKYLNIMEEELIEKREDAGKLAKEIYGPLLK